MTDTPAEAPAIKVARDSGPVSPGSTQGSDKHALESGPTNVAVEDSEQPPAEDAGDTQLSVPEKAEPGSKSAGLAEDVAGTSAPKDTPSSDTVMSQSAAVSTALLSNSTILPRPKLQRSPIPPPIDTENANKDAESSLRSKLLANSSPLSTGINESSSAAGAAATGASAAPSSQARSDGAAAPEHADSDGNAQAHIGVSFSKNRRYRRTMEDAHFHKYDFDGVGGQSLMAVFDGHAGRQAAQWCGDNFAEVFLKMKNDSPDLAVPELLNKVFLEVDRRLAEEVKTHSGCTAVVAFLEVKDVSTDGVSSRKRTLYCANVGDARAVLSRNGTAARLTYDHKGEDAREAQRISECGGYVFNGRVNGILAVTRALGDSSLKPFVIGNPFTTETHLEDTDELLILACDGLWDVCSDQEAVDLIRDDDDPAHASQVLLNHALSNESMDNITTLVFRLPPL